MATRLQVWRPDTCGCVIEQTHDPEADPNPVGLSQVLSRCAAHTLLTDQEVWDAVWSFPVGENRRKNLIRNRIFTLHGVEIVSFTFSGTGGARICTIVTSGLTANQRTAAQSWADTNIGVGKVVIT